MSHPALSRVRALSIIVLLCAVVLLASLPTTGQTTTQQPPLYRDPSSRIDGERPSTLLTNPALAFIKGDQAVTFSLNYKCIQSAAPPVNLDDDTITDRCALGTAATGSGRTVTVQYNATGTNFAEGESFTLAAGSGPSLTSPFDLLFTGTRDFSADDVVDGQTVHLRIRVPVDPSASNPGTCPGGSQGAAQNCFDPLDTTGPTEYTLKFDNFAPRFIVNDPADANAFRLTDNRWFLYSNQNLSNALPTLVVTVVDNTTGSPIDGAVTRIYRGPGDNDTTQIWDSTVVGGGHSIVYTYDYSDQGGESFRDNTSQNINLLFADHVGHQVDTRGDANLGLTVVMDITPPEFVDPDNSRLSRLAESRANRGGLAALGENLGVQVNATDLGADIDTPPEFLKVQVRLESGTLTSPLYDVPYNATSDSYFTRNVTIPNTWISGVTRANVTVTDPVGHTISSIINGTVSVDVDRPVVTPIAPLADDIAEGYQGSATITFRVRAEDPGDTDDWNGANTQDTDDLGVRLDDGVRVNYKVGRDGPVNTVRLSPLAAANTFSGTRTFNPEDEIFYYLSATDLAGNVETYPAASDPHILVNATQNEGRFLRLQIDQLGPVIEEARDLGYVGGGPHEFIFHITDDGIGLDESTPRFHWRLAGGGNYREDVLTEETIPLENATGVIQDTTVFRATIPTQPDGSQIQWHVSARDQLENIGSLGSSGSPESSVIDVIPPTVTVTAPDTSDVARFNITWQGTDAGAGIKDYTLQFRVGPNWHTVPSRERTTATSYEVCAATDTTYNFRVSARDNAGNTRDFPEQPDARTVVNAPTSCAQAPEVTISAPAAGATLTGPTTVRYLAASTSFPDSLRIRVEAGSLGSFQTVASGLENNGQFTWNTAAPQPEDLCLRDGSYTVRVVATDANNLAGSAEAGPVTLQNGITDCRDRDNDGLLDEWEFQHFGNLDASPGDDVDGDGFTNLQELQAGTDPNNPTSRPGGGGGGPGSEDEDWDPLYLLVVLGFVGVLGTFVVGMTRRW